jgi:hypothetical protein
METLSDLDVYQRLAAVAEELEALASQSGTLVGQTAAKTAAMTVRGMATAVYEHSLSEKDDGEG